MLEVKNVYKEFEKINKEKFDKLIHSGQDFSLYRKLCMGFPISFDSFAYMNFLLACNDAGNNFSFIKKMQSRH